MATTGGTGRHSGPRGRGRCVRGGAHNARDADAGRANDRERTVARRSRDPRVRASELSPRPAASPQGRRRSARIQVTADLDADVTMIIVESPFISLIDRHVRMVFPAVFVPAVATNRSH